MYLIYVTHIWGIFMIQHKNIYKYRSKQTYKKTISSTK